VQTAVILVALAVATALIVRAIGRLASALERGNEARTRGRVLQLVVLFAPAIESAATDPRAIVTWQPVAETARRLFPEEFSAIERTGAGRFPFGTDTIQQAHARCTADWLAWEKAHDATYKLKAAQAAAHASPLSDPAAVALARTQAEEIDREKLDLYQRRYEEYVRTAKALQALQP
jgi:hypothetical protein